MPPSSGYVAGIPPSNGILLPNHILSLILSYYVTFTRTSKDINKPPNPTYIRLVSRLFSSLALPIILRTITICCPRTFKRVVNAPAGPFLNPKWVRKGWVKEVELLFDLDEVQQDDLPCTPEEHLQLKLDTVRFWFEAGTCFDHCSKSDTDTAIELSTGVNAQRNNEQPSSLALSFLHRLNPRRFEWISYPPQHPTFSYSGSSSSCRYPSHTGPGLTSISPFPFRLLPPSQTLQQLLSPSPPSLALALSGYRAPSWSRLTSVHLENIALIRPSSQIRGSWSLFIPSIGPRPGVASITIRAPVGVLEAFVLQGRVRDGVLDSAHSPSLDSFGWGDGWREKHVRLEAQRAQGITATSSNVFGEVPVIAYANTTVSLVGWEEGEYRAFKDKLRAQVLWQGHAFFGTVAATASGLVVQSHTTTTHEPNSNVRTDAGRDVNDFLSHPYNYIVSVDDLERLIRWSIRRAVGAAVVYFRPHVDPTLLMAMARSGREGDHLGEWIAEVCWDYGLVRTFRELLLEGRLWGAVDTVLKGLNEDRGDDAKARAEAKAAFEVQLAAKANAGSPPLGGIPPRSLGFGWAKTRYRDRAAFAVDVGVGAPPAPVSLDASVSGCAMPAHLGTSVSTACPAISARAVSPRGTGVTFLRPSAGASAPPLLLPRTSHMVSPDSLVSAHAVLPASTPSPKFRSGIVSKKALDLKMNLDGIVEIGAKTKNTRNTNVKSTYNITSNTTTSISASSSTSSYMADLSNWSLTVSTSSTDLNQALDMAGFNEVKKPVQLPGPVQVPSTHDPEVDIDFGVVGLRFELGELLLPLRTKMKTTKDITRIYVPWILINFTRIVRNLKYLHWNWNWMNYAFHTLWTLIIFLAFACFAVRMVLESYGPIDSLALFGVGREMVGDGYRRAGASRFGAQVKRVAVFDPSRADIPTGTGTGVGVVTVNISPATPEGAVQLSADPSLGKRQEREQESRQLSSARLSSWHRPRLSWRGWKRKRGVNRNTTPAGLEVEMELSADVNARLRHSAYGGSLVELVGFVPIEDGEVDSDLLTLTLGSMEDTIYSKERMVTPQWYHAPTPAPTYGVGHGYVRRAQTRGGSSDSSRR